MLASRQQAGRGGRRRLRARDPGRLPAVALVGLFGFTEVRTTAGIVAGVIEVAAAAALGMLALTPRRARLRQHCGQLRAGARRQAAGRCARGRGGWSPVCRSLALVVLGGSVVAVRRQRRPRVRMRRRPEDRADRWRERPGQRQGLHPLLVRPGHSHQICLQRQLHQLLEAAEGPADPERGRDRHAGHHQALGRHRSRPPSTGIRCTPT